MRGKDLHEIIKRSVIFFAFGVEPEPRRGGLRLYDLPRDYLPGSVCVSVFVLVVYGFSVVLVVLVGMVVLVVLVGMVVLVVQKPKTWCASHVKLNTHVPHR